MNKKIKKKISIIIPSNHNHNDLFKLIISIINQTIKPNEVIIVNSLLNNENLINKINNIFTHHEINLKYINIDYALPGKARNIGLSMVNDADFIAFIDVKTIPRQDWLEESVRIIENKKVDGVWGTTCFCAESKLEKIVRDGFFGVLPQKTLPGSIFRQEVFYKVGHFIDWVRAGEDTEWMLRLVLLKIAVISSPRALIDYVGLIGSSGIIHLLKKWSRNYMAARNLPHLFPQKLLLWLVLYPILVLIAFNWNYLVADWRMDSPFYLGHVTKFIVILPSLVYIILRGFILPLRRGVTVFNLLPVRFLSITVICLLADIVKLIMFTIPNRRRR
jgi:hypothetical protein